MNKKKFSWERFEIMPIVGIVRGLSMEDFKQILPIYIKAGLTTIEVTMNTKDADKLIEYAVTKYSDVLNVGAGTVCSSADLEIALNSGSQFIVTPIINEEVIISCVDKNIPIFPGALTPTEIYKAWSLGASMVKIYPAGNLGANYIKDVKAPLNKIRMMPTGGIGLNNLADFFHSGADGFGIGSPLFEKELIRNKDWYKLEEHFVKFVSLFRNLDLYSK